ncbi:unnamed protein product [Penicillium camemberti]|uniref:Str. FM013 n=1 Tax=Penicillium camemberti (strain FM 013) TaxID=1429867 RepID=A0A0G4P0M3_PENC3|nr:unnamed protein product [Penicillium camemberti]
MKHGRPWTATMSNDSATVISSPECREGSSNETRSTNQRTGSQRASLAAEAIYVFLSQHFLHWVEAMSLMRMAPEIVGVIDTLHSLIEEHSPLILFLRDARRFVQILT